MDWIINWLLTAVPTVVLGASLAWLSKSWIITRLTKSVEHEFNVKMESLRADLRTKESEITALRDNVLTAMSSRHQALDKRRLEAVDQLWAEFLALGPARGQSNLMAIIKFDGAAKLSAQNPRAREAFSKMGAGFDLTKYNSTLAAKARPYVTPMVWALFSAYQSIVLQAALKLSLLKIGLDDTPELKNDGIITLFKVIYPQSSSYFDEHKDDKDFPFHLWLEDIETKFLTELQRMMSGEDTDQVTLTQATEIIKVSKELMECKKDKEIRDLAAQLQQQ